MNYIDFYIKFCRKFNNLKIPKIKFKVIKENITLLYQKDYNIDDDNINKASFFILIAVFITMIIISLIITVINVIYIIIYSFIISLLVSYWFNLILYNDIRERGSRINTLLNIIQINFSLIQKTMKKNSDHCLNFIILMINYNLPLSESFKKILSGILEGKTPEKELSDFITPSKDFNKYINGLLINNFYYDKSLDIIEDRSLEKKFKVFLRQLQNKIALVFFIGLFFPIGLCFLIFFQAIPLIITTLCIPIFMVFIHFLFEKFVKSDIHLIGMLTNTKDLERRKLDEFLKFIKNFATNLSRNISPEKALIDTYNDNINALQVLKELIGNQVANILTNSQTFKEVISNLKIDLKSYRYTLILESVKQMVSENAYYTSGKILDIIQIIHKHRKLEKKLSIIIKGEQFKVIIFIILLPIIIGTIGGMHPFFSFLNLNLEMVEIPQYSTLIDEITVWVIFLTMFSCIIITTYYFLKIINKSNKIPIFSVVITIFIFFFILSYTIVKNSFI